MSINRYINSRGPTLDEKEVGRMIWESFDFDPAYRELQRMAFDLFHLVSAARWLLRAQHVRRCRR